MRALNTFGIVIVLGLLSAQAAAFNAAAQTSPAQSQPAKQVEVAPVSAASLSNAKAFAAKGKLDQALSELETLSRVQPEEKGVERLRGIVLYQKEMLPEALLAFARAVEQDSTDHESMEMQGITLYRLGRPDEAIPLLEKADTEVTGANADPKYVLGLCYTDAKRYDDARRAFAAQFGFQPDSAEAYLAAARLFLRRDFADEARRFAQKAVEINPSLPLTHQLLGEIALAKADLPLAVKELETERKLNPMNGEMYDRLGDAYVRNGQFEEARQALNKAILLEPNATGPYILLGEALVNLNEPIQALHYLNRAVTMDPGNYVTHTVLGQAYRAMGQVSEANREYKLAVAIQHKGDPKPPQSKE
jgi:tetratricopeptide (TPR) repeat protein